MTSIRTLIGGFFAFLIGCLILVGVAEVALRFIYPTWADFSVNRFVQTEPAPGLGIIFTGKPGFNGYFAQNNGDFRAHIHINDLASETMSRLKLQMIECGYWAIP